MNIRDRSIIITALFLCIEVILVGHLLGYASIVNRINPQSDAAQERIIQQEIRDSTVPGTVTDRNGTVLTYAEEPGGSVKFICPTSYSLLLGYNSAKYGQSGMLADSRLGKYLYVPDSTKHGATAKLTLDNDVQQVAYNALQGYDASACVLEVSTGKVIALVSNDPDVSFDFSSDEKIAESLSKANGYDGSLIPNWKVYIAPGSDIKALTACGIVERGWQNEIYKDTGRQSIDGCTIRNAYRGGKGNIHMREALIHSCNCYFFYYADRLGYVQMKDLYERFGIGEKIELDFMTLHSRHNLNESTRSEIANAGYGQGKLEINIVSISMLAAALGNNGELMIPYMVDCVFNADGELMHTVPTVYKQSVSSETAAVVNEALAATAKSYGFSNGIYAKTGTAEIGDGTNRAVLMTHNGKYAVVVVVDETHLAGKSLKPIVEEIYKALAEADARTEGAQPVQ